MAPLRSSRSAGGLTNTNYKVRRPDGCYVVRISNKDSGLLAIDRENEAHNTTLRGGDRRGRALVAALPKSTTRSSLAFSTAR